MKRFVFLPMFVWSMAIFAQTDMPVFLMKNGYAKRMANVFEFLADGKLQKAIKEQEDVKEKFAKDKDIDKRVVTSVEYYLSPLWQVSNSVIMNMEEGRQNPKEPISVNYDPWKAYKALKLATSAPLDKNAIDEFFRQRKLAFTVESIKSSIEAHLVAETEKVRTEEAYDKLVDELYEYADWASVISRREKVAFEESMQSTSVEKQKRYLGKYIGYSSIYHQQQITHRRDSLAFEQMDKNVSGFKEYLNNYPQSEYYDEVTKLLHKYEFDSLEKSVKGCKDYLAKYPDSEYAKQVNTMMVNYAYDDAIKKDSPEAIAIFLEEFGKSEKRNEAVKALNQMLRQKVFNYGVSLSELENITKNRTYDLYIDLAPYKALYSNLIHLPTSAAMMDCRGLTGEVKTTISASDNEYTETLRFNEQGLLVGLNNSRSGQSDSWEYESNDKGEICSFIKTNGQGKKIIYKVAYNAEGMLTIISGSDGTKTSYSYNSDNSLKTITYSKEDKNSRIDHFNGNIVSQSNRVGVTIYFEYNGKGDVISMEKKRGSILMDQTSFEYEYDSGNHWTTMRQYNNGNYFLTKRRTFTS